MQRRNRWLAAVVIAAGLSLSGCAHVGEEAAASGENDPAKVVRIEGTDLSRVILTPEAAQRLGIRTEPVAAAPATTTGAAAARSPVLPMAAVLYDKDGTTWTYTNPEPLTYVREKVVLGRIDGDHAELRSGPAPGTQVVTVGSAELLGAEYGVEGE